jgi:hypothetical protein
MEWGSQCLVILSQEPGENLTECTYGGMCVS